METPSVNALVNPLDPTALADFPTYQQHDSWTRQQLMDYQARALQACRDYAYANSPFYQRFHRGLMDRPLQELPALTKATLMENFDELVTDRAVRLHDVQQYLAKADPTTPYLGRYRVMATSGSSGRPGFFLANPTELAMFTNTGTRFQTWGGLTASSKVVVIGSGAPGHMSSQFPIVVDGQRIIPLQLSTMDPVETLVQQLNEWQPDTLFAYPAIASRLADEQQQGRLHISPRSLCYSGEMMPGNVRRRIEDIWQAKFFQVYATSESGAMATECELHQGLHIFEDFTIVEVVDKNNQPVAPGEKGAKVLLTVLFRRTQPLIRYEVSDLLRTSTQQSCPCGRPYALLESVEGRTAEMLYLQTPSGGKEGMTALHFETIFDTLPVGGWQIVQEYDGLHVFLAGASDELTDEYLLDALQRGLNRLGILVPNIEIHRVADLYRNPTGKAPMLISHVPSNAS